MTNVNNIPDDFTSLPRSDRGNWLIPKIRKQPVETIGKQVTMIFEDQSPMTYDADSIDWNEWFTYQGLPEDYNVIAYKVVDV